MEQEIVNALALAINEVFPEYPVLDMTLDQEVGRPAFMINIVESAISERITHAGFFVRYVIDILFEPDAVNREAEMRRVMDELKFILRRVENPESEFAFRPYWIHFQNMSGILHCTFNIRVAFMPKKFDTPKVERSLFNTETKHE